MTAPCPGDEILAALPEGHLPAPEREAVERHAAACARCRELLLLSSVGREVTLEIPRRPAWRWRAAAAALLLAGGWALLHPPAPLEPGAASPPGGDFPAGLLGGPNAVAYLHPGIDLLLEGGGRVQCDPGARRLRAEAGRFWLGTGGGEGLTLDIAGTSLVLKDATVAVTLPHRPPTQAWQILLREAAADPDKAPCVDVLEGAVLLEGKAVPAGTRLQQEAGGKGWRGQPASQDELAALREARLTLLLALPGSPVSLGGRRVPRTYRWVTTLLSRNASTEVGLTLGVPDAAGASWYRWVAGLAKGSPGRQEVLEATWDGKRLTGRLNGVTLFSAERGALGQLLRPVEGGAWTLSVWGGSAVVERSMIQEGM